MRDADLAASYRDLGEKVTPAVGVPFCGMFDVADLDAFDGTAQAGDFALRYPAAVVLAVGAVLTIRGTQYRVAADPQRLGDGYELVVRLRKGAA